MTLRRFVPVILVLAVACGGGSREPRTIDSGIEGVTTSGPQCPVEVAGSPCPDAPISVGLFVTKRGSSEVAATTRSNDRGEFRVVLAPGDYTIHPLASSGPPTAVPQDVTVRAHAVTRVTIAFDSGIR